MFTFNQLLLITMSMFLGYVLSAEIASPFMHGWSYPIIIGVLIHLLILAMFIQRYFARYL